MRCEEKEGTEPVHRAVLTAFDILTERTEIYDMYIATENLFQHVDNVETLEMASITTRHVHAGYLNEVHPYPRLLKTNGVIGTAIGCIDERALSHNQPTRAREVMQTFHVKTRQPVDTPKNHIRCRASES